jgi:hypothetical protein
MIQIHKSENLFLSLFPTDGQILGVAGAYVGSQKRVFQSVGRRF